MSNNEILRTDRERSWVQLESIGVCRAVIELKDRSLRDQWHDSDGMI